jgi:hypothetical protein
VKLPLPLSDPVVESASAGLAQAARAPITATPSTTTLHPRRYLANVDHLRFLGTRRDRAASRLTVDGRTVVVTRVDVRLAHPAEPAVGVSLPLSRSGGGWGGTTHKVWCAEAAGCGPATPPPWRPGVPGRLAALAAAGCAEPIPAAGASGDGSALAPGTCWPAAIRPGPVPVSRRASADRRIRKLSLDSTPSGRPELQCEAHVSGPAPRSLRLDWTIKIRNEKRTNRT